MTTHANDQLQREREAGATPRLRLSSLDGLRGLAALIVVFHHLSLTNAAVSAVILGDVSVPPPMWTAAWWVTSTPAQLLVAGHEAVLVFFVLSGFVVALPVLRKVDFNWAGYFVQRVIRLYLPVIASVLLAVLWIVTSAQNEKTAVSSWTAGSSVSQVTLSDLLANFDLLRSGFSLNNPVWSLRWELVFSLALAVFVIVAMAVRRWWLLAVLLCIVVSGFGMFTRISSLEYLPVFLIGTILASRLTEIQEWAASVASRSFAAPLGVAATVLSLFCLNAHWMLWAAFGSSGWLTLIGVLKVVGAFGLVVVTIVWTPAIRMLSTRVFRWLGTISFSLYLVHVPVIIAVSALVPRGNGALVILLALIISLSVAQLFYLAIERPSHRFARFAGKAAGQLSSEWFARASNNR